jgi:ABC-type lipoprotein release transport system permease subunit
MAHYSRKIVVLFIVLPGKFSLLPGQNIDMEIAERWTLERCIAYALKNISASISFSIPDGGCYCQCGRRLVWCNTWTYSGLRDGKMLDCPVVVTNQSILLSFAVCAVVGIFFGWYPARKAAGLDPIDALRFE